jgi:hypothetical protein
VASIIGLGTRNGVVGMRVDEPLAFKGGCVPPGTGRKLSANHSYHTLFLSVKRQMETCSSALFGRYKGS